ATGRAGHGRTGSLEPRRQTRAAPSAASRWVRSMTLEYPAIIRTWLNRGRTAVRADSISSRRAAASTHVAAVSAGSYDVTNPMRSTIDGASPTGVVTGT